MLLTEADWLRSAEWHLVILVGDRLPAVKDLRGPDADCLRALPADESQEFR